MVFVLLITMAVNSGCEPFRKKFVRKKKEEKKNEFIPVLEPVDYDERVKSAQERYEQHYSLWKVWEKDFLQAIQEKNPIDKQQEYALNQMVVQMQEMAKWITGEKKDYLVRQIQEVKRIQNEYEKPAQLRDAFSLINRMRRIGKAMREGLSPKLLSEDFVKL